MQTKNSLDSSALRGHFQGGALPTRMMQGLYVSPTELKTLFSFLGINHVARTQVGLAVKA